MEKHLSSVVVLLVSWIIFFNLLLVTAGEVLIDPPAGLRPDGDLVVDAGSTFSLTCRGDSPLVWAYNDYDNDEKSEKEVKSGPQHGQEVSTLTVIKAFYLDTGYFSCYPLNEGRTSPQAQKIYVYVKDTDPERYLAVNDSLTVIPVHQFGVVDIPCKPTDPDLTVELRKDDMVVPGIKYDPHVGFEFHIDKVHDSGQYLCVIGDYDVIDFFVHVDIMSNKTSVERPHIHVSPTPVVEGADVTFECEVHYDIGVKLKLTWVIPHPHVNQSGRLYEHESVEEEKMGDHVKNYKARRTITLTDVSKQDEGEYTCHVVDNSENHNSKSVMLSVIPSGTHTLRLDVRGYENGSQIPVNPGQNDVHLLVDIVAHPPAKSIQWYDNSMKPMIGKTENYSVNNTATLAKLTIMQPSVHNSGTYILVVNNGAFNKSISVTLLVKGEPELIVNKEKEQGYYLVNQSYTIDCDVFALPQPNITWYFKPCPEYPVCSSQFSLIPRKQYTEQEIATDNSSPFKSMVQIRAEQTGMLECRACNNLGCASKDTMIIVTDVENGLSIEKLDLVVETDNVTLSCGASKYNYSESPEWLKVEKNGPSPVKDLEMLITESKLSFFNKLLIPRVGKNHSGVYICSAKLRYERNRSNTQKFKLDVKDLEKPVIHKNVSTKASVRTGQPVKLFCHVKGSPPPIISWYMNGERILKEKHKNIEFYENNQTLSIGGVGLENKGRYECRASNKAGADELIIDIEITDIKSIFFHWFLWYILPLLVLLLILAALFYWHYVRKYKRKIKELKEIGLEYFENGKVECINPEIDISEQADLLPYDRHKWEFPRDKLKLGKQLGAGAFGMVLKAEAYELMEPGVATTVAVKMVKRNSDSATIRALASELKILIHLGKHLNVVNVLGACTGDLNKRELLVLVEYCRYGNLRNYLLQHRGAFINQVNPQTGQFDSTFIEPLSPGAVSNRFSYSNGKAYDSAAVSQTTDTTLVMSDMSVANNPTTAPVGEDGYLVSRDHEWRNQDRGEYKDTGLRPVCTQDLICWSFQIARGMEYLASRKVLHGDLAARNILLAEDNIVKICDFGLSKSVYKYSDYKKKGEGPLPVKWMALESIRDRVFSTQSDVWSYGITLWELFSLACTPYPGMEVDKGLYQKLVGGYRMEKPKYATKQVYQVMKDCWHENPHSRPSFTELAERMGGMLEDTVRTHYVDLNDPYLQQNSEFLAQQDYLSMLHSPSYVNWNSGYTSMKPASPRGDEVMELTPMLSLNATESDSLDGPEGSPIVRTKPIGNDYVNVTHVLGFSNPSYQNLGRPKKSPYVNVPHG